MKNKAFLLVLLALGMAFAGLSVPSWNLSKESYRPGSDGVVTVEITNPVVQGVDTQIVNAVDIDINTPPQLAMAGQQFVGDIEPGGSTRLSLPFKIAANASSAIYSIELEISGFSDRPGVQGGFDTFSRRVTIPVMVLRDPILQLSSEDQLLSGTKEFNLTITNTGGIARNARLKIGSGSQVALYGTDEIFIPSIAGSAKISAILDSRSAIDGPVDIPFVIEYEDELGNLISDDAPMRMTVRNEKLNLNFNQKTELFTRKDSTLTLELVNNGDTNLKDVRLEFLNTSVRLKSEEELKFGDIPAGGTATVTAEIFTDAPPGVNSVDSLLTYIEKDVQKEETRKVPLTVTSDADVAVYLEAKPLPLTLGSEHTISVLVSNLGSYRIENVDVSLSSPGLRSVDISDRQYIGGLSNDDFSTVQFQMQVNASAEGSYPARITVNYRDQSGEWKQKVIDQDVSIYSAPAPDGDMMPLLAVLAVAGVAVWWFRFRKK